MFHGRGFEVKIWKTMRWKPILKRTFQVFIAILLLLVIAEAGLRFAGHQILLSRYWAENNWPYKEGDINVVCLGESTTAGIWVDPSESYPAQLTRMLQEHYSNPRIHVVVPPHVGQNTSQQANRIDDYIEIYKPKVLILMAGANNEWAFAESNIGQFLSINERTAWEIRARIFLDQFRVFKAMRFFSLGLNNFWKKMMSGDADALVVWGHPQSFRYPPEQEIADFAKNHMGEFLSLWRTDVEYIIRTAQKKSVKVILMNYPVTPGYLSPLNFQRVAGRTGSVLVENNEDFAWFAEKGEFDQFVFERDHFHPTAAGYTVVARNAAKAIIEGDLLGLESTAHP